MKKLKLKAQELGAVEILTRKQLKNVLGGVAEATTTAEKCPYCSNSDQCKDSSCKTCGATGDPNRPGKCGGLA